MINPTRVTLDPSEASSQFLRRFKSFLTRSLRKEISEPGIPKINQETRLQRSFFGSPTDDRITSSINLEMIQTG